MMMSVYFLIKASDLLQKSSIFKYSTTNKTVTVSRFCWSLNFWKIFIFKGDMTLFWDTLRVILLHSVTPYWVCTKENMKKLHTILNKSQKLINTPIIGFYNGYIFEYINFSMQLMLPSSYNPNKGVFVKVGIKH